MSEQQGYKAFNSTGRDDSTTEIIKPKGGAQRTALFVGVVLVFIIGLCYFGFRQTGLNPLDPPADDHGGLGSVPRVKQNTSKISD